MLFGTLFYVRVSSYARLAYLQSCYLNLCDCACVLFILILVRVLVQDDYYVYCFAFLSYGSHFGSYYYAHAH